MNHYQGRVSWMLVAVASFAVVAAWQVVVRPMSAKAESQSAAFEDMSADVEQGLKDIAATAVHPHEILSLMESKASEYQSSFVSIGTGSDIYNHFDPLARRARLTISRLEPTDLESKFTDGSAEVTTSRFVVEGDGTLEAVREFISLIQSESGLCKITSLRIIPARSTDQESALVHVTLRTEHITIENLFGSEDEVE